MERPRKRFYVADSYEEVYLQFNSTKKCLANAKTDVLANKDLLRVLKQKTQQIFRNSYIFWLSHGIEMDDLSNIILTFGAKFYGLPQFESYDISHRSILLRFIDQHMWKFKKATRRKFQSDEVVSDIEQLTIDDQERSVFSLENHSNEDEDYTPITNQKIYNSTYVAQGRAAINANPQKYALQLAWYSTTKHVGKDVRQAARQMCRKLEIDYKKWALTQIEQGTSSIEFDLQ